MNFGRRIERAILRWVTGLVNGRGRLLLQRVPLAFSGDVAGFLALRRDWIAGDPKDNDRDLARLAALALNVRAVEAAGIPGAFAELGVWRGNSAKVIHRLAPGRELYLLDTFGGFDAADTAADRAAGVAHHFRDVTPEGVRAFVGQSPRVHFVVGRFPDTAGAIPDAARFAFVHIDCDLYRPALAALAFFYPRMSPKGMIVVHDYASGRWPGLTQAVDEFLADKPEGAVLLPDLSGSVAIVCRGVSATAAAAAAVPTGAATTAG